MKKVPSNVQIKLDIIQIRAKARQSKYVPDMLEQALTGIR